MKQETIRKLIEESGVKGFDFDNDDVCITWEVTPGAGKMLARRIADHANEDYEEQLFAVPYADIFAVDNLYETIVADFTVLYYEDLRSGAIDESGLFSSIASRCDEGLLEMLSFFGKNYNEFLGDVLRWYGTYTEIVAAVMNAVTEDEEEDCESSSLDEDSRLVIKVLDRFTGRNLDISSEENGIGYYWNFAEVRGELWYSLVDYGFGDEGYYVGEPQYGHVLLSDEDARSAIRDMVLAELEMEGWQYVDSGNCLELLGIVE